MDLENNSLRRQVEILEILVDLEEYLKEKGNIREVHSILRNV